MSIYGTYLDYRVHGRGYIYNSPPPDSSYFNKQSITREQMIKQRYQSKRNVAHLKTRADRRFPELSVLF